MHGTASGEVDVSENRVFCVPPYRARGATWRADEQRKRLPAAECESQNVRQLRRQTEKRAGPGAEY
jgi:hypothetical protein